MRVSFQKNCNLFRIQALSFMDGIMTGIMAQNASSARLESLAANRDEDQELVAAALQEFEAAGRLFDKYYADIIGYIFRSTLDRTVAEDLTSNVFLSALRHLGLFRWRGVPFGAWLYRIATNEIRVHYRRQNRLPATTVISPDLASDLPNAAEAFAVTEDYRLLHGALLELPLKYRTVIVLRFFEGKSIEEIAVITGNAQGTIKSQLHRGLDRLQTILERLGVRTSLQADA
jgi:RNA polymerase sigma-70 factor (ECF subfamily)